VSKLLGFFDSFNRIQISRCRKCIPENFNGSCTQDVAQAVANHRGLLRVAARQKLNAIHDDWSPRCHFVASVCRSRTVWTARYEVRQSVPYVEEEENTCELELEFLGYILHRSSLYPSVNRFLRISLDITIATTWNLKPKDVCVSTIC